MKNKIKNLLFLSLILLALIGVLAFNISKFSSSWKKNNVNSNNSDVLKEDDSGNLPNSGENISINEYYSNSEDGEDVEVPIENGKVLSDIYNVDISNYSILSEFYGWDEEAARLNYFIIENAILMKLKKDAKYEIVPDSMTPLDLEKETILTFKCRDFYSKKELFSITFNRHGRAIAEEIKNIVQ